MKNFLLSSLLVAGIIALSCNHPADKTAETEVREEVVVKKVKEVTADGHEKTVASIGIEGMTCEVGCAKMINKTLSDMEGVNFCEVVFEDKVAHIEYDDQQISEKDFIQKIEGLHDGQYVVNDVTVKQMIKKDAIKNSAAGETETEGNSGKKTLEQTDQLVSFPNIFDAFTRLYPF